MVSVGHRSNEFWARDVIQVIGQTRMVPDLLIIFPGAGGLLLFMLKAMTRLKPVEVQPGKDFT